MEPEEEAAPFRVESSDSIASDAAVPVDAEVDVASVVLSRSAHAVELPSGRSNVTAALDTDSPVLLKSASEASYCAAAETRDWYPPNMFVKVNSTFRRFRDIATMAAHSLSLYRM